MEQIIITMGSVTTATRFRKLLKNRLNIHSEIIHTPTALNCGSCSYSLRFVEKNIGNVKNLAQEFGLKIKGIYREGMNIRGEKQYNAVS